MSMLDKWKALAALAEEGGSALKGLGKDALLGKEIHGPGALIEGVMPEAKAARGQTYEGNGKSWIQDMGREGGLKDLAAEHPKASAAMGGLAIGAGADHEIEDDDSAVNELLRKLGLG